MLQFVARRLLIAVPTLFGVYTLVFVLLRLLPGDPAAVMLSQASASKADIDRLRVSLGLDDPLYRQYLDSLADLIRGHWGRSITYNRPVLDLIGEFFPYTLRLTMAGLGLAVTMGLTLGTIAALHHNRWLDNLTMVIALGGVSIPTFWLGLMGIYLFSLRLGWLPITEGAGPTRIIMPAVAMALYSSAVIARLTRSSLLEVLHQDYVLTARAKGLSAWAVTVRHALRNALIPVMTVIGVQFGTLLSGAVITETIFARPGLGKLVVDSIQNKDIPMVQGVILVLATIYILINLLVDLSYAIIDPRIRYQ